MINTAVSIFYHIQRDVENTWLDNIVVVLCIFCITTTNSDKSVVILVQSFQGPCRKPIPLLQGFDKVSTCNGAPKTVMPPFWVSVSKVLIWCMVPVTYHWLLTDHRAYRGTHNLQRRTAWWFCHCGFQSYCMNPLYHLCPDIPQAHPLQFTNLLPVHINASVDIG